MKILLVSEYTGLGGGETSLLQIAKELVKQEQKPIVLCPRKGALTSVLEKEGIPYVVQDIEVNRKTAYKIITLRAALSRLIEELEIDVIHCNGLPPVFLFGFLAKKKNIPLFWTCHGQWFRFTRLKQKLTESLVTRIFCVSDAVKRSLDAQGFSHRILKTMPPGLSTKTFAQGVNHRTIEKKMEGMKKEIVVGMIARFQKVKGQLLFVKAAEKVLQTNPDIKFVMIGGNTFQSEEDEKYYQTVVKEIQGKRLEHDIYFLGQRKDIPDLLQEIDIVVVPSYSESFGMVIIEALAAKRCVISTATDGPREILKDGITGILTPIGDHGTLAQQILELAEDEPKRKSLGERGHAAVVEQYDIKKTVKNILKEYRSVL